MISEQIGVRARGLRYDLGLTQEAFANSIGMARSYYSEVESGKRNISVHNLHRIADGMDVSLAEFFASAEFDGAFDEHDSTPDAK